MQVGARISLCTPFLALAIVSFFVSMINRFLVLFLATFVAAFAHARKNQEFIYLNTEDTLHIIVIDNMYDYGGGSSFHRYFYFESTLNELLKEIDFPMRWKVDEFGSRVPKDMPCIYITVQKWGLDRLGQIEVRLSAYLRDPSGEKNSLGHYSQSDFSSMMMTGSRRHQAYNDVLKKALVKVVRDLDEHLPIPDGETESATPSEDKPSQ